MITQSRMKNEEVDIPNLSPGNAYTRHGKLMRVVVDGCKQVTKACLGLGKAGPQLVCMDYNAHQLTPPSASVNAGGSDGVATPARNILSLQTAV